MYAGRIYADFQNLDDENRVRLDTAGTVRDLTAGGITLQEGATLSLYTDDADDNGNPDPLFATGIIEFNAEGQCWVARVDWSALRHASELQAESLQNHRHTKGTKHVPSQVDPAN